MQLRLLLADRLPTAVMQTPVLTVASMHVTSCVSRNFALRQQWETRAHGNMGCLTKLNVQQQAVSHFRGCHCADCALSSTLGYQVAYGQRSGSIDLLTVPGGTAAQVVLSRMYSLQCCLLCCINACKRQDITCSRFTCCCYCIRKVFLCWANKAI